MGIHEKRTLAKTTVKPVKDKVVKSLHNTSPYS